MVRKIKLLHTSPSKEIRPRIFRRFRPEELQRYIECYQNSKPQSSQILISEMSKSTKISKSKHNLYPS